MVSALRDVVTHARSLVTLEPGDTVIDIGANDGTLLREYPEGIRRVAFEPAQNLWPLLQGKSWDSTRDIATIYGYFPMLAGGDVVGMEPGAKIITSIACFYDADDPGQFVEGIKKSLAPDGVWINQLAYLPDTTATGNFGDICHEHLTYWMAYPFNHLLSRYGLEVLDVKHNGVNGGSIRFVVGHGETRVPSSPLPEDLPSFEMFRKRIEEQRQDVRDFLIHQRYLGRKVIGYGASTKGSTYLQYWNIGPHLMPLIADRNPDKWGKYTPTGQLVISEAEARAEKPDYFFCLPWHFIEAFTERESAYLAQGGQFVVPFPSLHFVKGGDSDTHVFKKATFSDHGAAVRS